MSNKFRGEVEVTLNIGEGKLEKFILRPTFEAMVEFEERSKTNAGFVLQEMLATKSIGFKLLACSIYAGLLGSGQLGKMTFGELGVIVMRTGMLSLVPVIGEFLTNALTSEADQRAAEEEASGKSNGVGN